MPKRINPKINSNFNIEDTHLLDIYKKLGIPSSYPRERGLSPFYQAELNDLVVSDIDVAGRPFVLTKAASLAWQKLSKASEMDKVIIQPLSAFRSYLYQQGLIEGHLSKGRSIDDILENVAPPGYSEHHTGCAIDIMTPGCAPLVEELEGTDAFKWMEKNAGDFGFVMSFDRNNKFGFVYEPWHWCFAESSSL